jgi:two-component system copper resistance phosphate regulon response regulator CusR
MQNGNRILVVDGDIHLGKFLKRQLGRKDYQVDHKTDGKDAGDEIHGNICDLLILDLDLPGIDGLALLQRIRATLPRLPVLVLTARSRTEDIVRGLDEGADDYLIKPFSFLELVARIRVLLSRNYVHPAAVAPIPGGLTINRETHQAFRGHRRIDLTLREFEVLEYLVNNSGKVLSRKTLMEDVWKIAYDPATNVVDVYMKYLRDKIAIDGETKLIRTIRGVGYVLSDVCERPALRVIEAAPRSMFQDAAVLDAACAA